MMHEEIRQKSSPIAYWTFDDGSDYHAADSISGIEDEIEFALRKGRFQPPKNPVWCKGIKGSALLFDGYSTYVKRSASKIKKPSDSLTICAWIAPRTYDYGAEQRLAAIVNQHDRERGQGYILGITRHGAWSLQLGINHRWVEVWSLHKPIPLNQWSFVCGTYDRESRMLKLYCNGELVVYHWISEAGAIIPCDTDLMIGRNNQGVVLAEAFVMNHFDGLIDELAIYDYALSASEIRDAYQQSLIGCGNEIPPITWQEVVTPRRYFTEDRHRPQFHLTPPGHWMNEPHAPFYYQGKYHLFYQYNPSGPFWHYIHWGHWVSDDLVHWRDLPPALIPEQDIDPDGVWSGSASVDENGCPVLFFTAGNHSESPNQSVGLAKAYDPRDEDLDLVRWEKHPVPVLRRDPGTGLNNEFRDPFVWKDEGIWYMLVGSGIEGQGGTAALYTSSDMLHWDFQGPFYLSDYKKHSYLGTAWELPVFLPLQQQGKPSGKYILLISPWGEGAKVEVNYWIGTFDKERMRFIPDDEEPGLIDIGDFHFTGPSGMVDPVSGRTLLFTIAQGERTPEIDYDCGWSHCAGLPVSLYLREDNRLGIEPMEEIRSLRIGNLMSLRETTVTEANEALAQCQGDMLEIELTMSLNTMSARGIALRCSPDGEEETVVYYDPAKQYLCVDRTKSTKDPNERTGGVQGGALPLQDEHLKLHIFVDRSLIEVYANGLRSLTTRAYPSRSDALGLRLVGEGNTEIVSMNIWKLKSIF